MSVSVGADNLNYLSKFNNQTVNRLLHALSSKDPLGCSPEDVLAVLPRPAGAVQSESTAELSSTLDSAKATTRRDREKRRHEDVEAPAKAGSNKRKAVAKHNARHILPPDSDMHPSGDSLASEMDFDRRWFDPQADALRSLGPDFPSSEFEFGFGDALLDDVPFSPAKSARTRGQYRGGFFSSPRPAPSSPMVPGPTFRSSESASSDPHQHLPSSVSAQITVDLLDAAILPEWSVPSAPGSLPSTAAAPANGIEPTALPAFSQDTVAWSQSFDSVVQLPTIPSILLLKSSQYLPIEDVIPNESKKSSETTTGAEPTPSAQISDVLDTNSPVSTSVDHGQYDAPLDQTVVLDDAHTPAAAAAAREREDFSELCRDVFTLFSLPRRARGKVLCDEDKVHTAAEEVGLILSSGSFRTQQVRLFSASSVSKLLGKPTQRRRISDIFAFLETLDMVGNELRHSFCYFIFSEIDINVFYCRSSRTQSRGTGRLERITVSAYWHF